MGRDQGIVTGGTEFTLAQARPKEMDLKSSPKELNTGGSDADEGLSAQSDLKSPALLGAATLPINAEDCCLRMPDCCRWSIRGATKRSDMPPTHARATSDWATTFDSGMTHREAAQAGHNQPRRAGVLLVERARINVGDAFKDRTPRKEEAVPHGF